MVVLDTAKVIAGRKGKTLLDKSEGNTTFTVVEGASELAAMGYTLKVSNFGQITLEKTPAPTAIAAPALPGNAAALPGIVAKPAKAAKVKALIKALKLPAAYEAWVKDNYQLTGAFDTLKAGVPALTQEQWNDLSK